MHSASDRKFSVNSLTIVILV